VVTRPRAQAADFVEWLEAQGAEAVLFPAIRIVPPEDPAPLRRAAAGVGSYDWIVFTSANGVERFWEEMAAQGIDPRALAGARLAAIGPATAAALAARGARADAVPESYVGEAVADALGATGPLRGARVLLPRAAGARAVLPERLVELGATVDDIESYRSVPDREGAVELRRRLDARQIDAVTFTSSSTVRNFVEAVGVELGGAAVACIGPVTAETARTLGLRPDVVAPEHTVAGLESALLAFFGAAGRDPHARGSGGPELVGPKP
jgi:uroporphyrinogen III methyltransferase/synthase